MRLEYSKYIAYLRGANAAIGTDRVTIRSYKEAKINGNRLVTFGIEVSGMPTNRVDEARQLAKSIVRATRIASVMNNAKIEYYYDGGDAANENDMGTLISMYRGLFENYVNEVERICGQ